MMATYRLYDAAVTATKDGLACITHIITKCEASPAAATIPNARIHPDMLPFTFQAYQVAANSAKMIARLTGVEPKDYSYSIETYGTYDSLKALVAEVQTLVDSVTPELINSRENEVVTFGLGRNVPPAQLPAWAYVHGYSLPNLYFHLVTAYDIARKEGVDIGKNDYQSHFLVKFLNK